MLTLVTFSRRRAPPARAFTHNRPQSYHVLSAKRNACSLARAVRPRSNVMMHSSRAYIFFIPARLHLVLPSLQRVSSRIPCPKESRGALRLTFPTERTTAGKKEVISPGDLVNSSTGKRAPTTSDWTSAATARVRKQRTNE